jgi:esterase/lipase superfamily enzyme
MSDKFATRWYSERLHCDVSLVRWGGYGRPVLLLPTAGGDAEEVERFSLIEALGWLIGAGRIKVYSCDSVAGRAMLAGEGSPQHRMWLQNQFQEYIRHEVVPAVRADCRSHDIELWAAGASIGAFYSVAMVCRYPDVFARACAMSGTHDVRRFFHTDDFHQDFWTSSPMHFLPSLSAQHMDRLRGRFIVLPSGEGDHENIAESWAMAHVLGSHGVPNRVDPWGPEWPHDWQTWRTMLPKYLDEWTR